MAHWLFLPNEALKDLRTLASLSNEKFGEFRKFLDSPKFALNFKSYVRLAELAGLSDEAAGSLSTFISYVQRQRAKYKKPGDAVPGEIEHFLKNQSDPDSERLLKYVRENGSDLAALFSDLPTSDFAAKVRGLEAGPVPSLKEFRAICDLRPVYNAEGDKIVSCIPIITCHLVTHSTETHESKETLVQLTEADIKEFTDQFDRLEKKLAELKNRFSSFLAKKVEE